MVDGGRQWWKGRCGVVDVFVSRLEKNSESDILGYDFRLEWGELEFNFF